MTIALNGKRYVKVYLNGKEYGTAYFNRKLVLFAPDYNQYLLAKPEVYLTAGRNYFLGYNTTPQVISDQVSGEALGTKPFEIQFAVNRDYFTTGTRYLFEVPGMVRVKSEGGQLGLYFPWEELPKWKYLPASALADGWNNVLLKQDGVKLTVGVNEKMFTLLDSTGSEKHICYSCVDASSYIQLAKMAPLATAQSWEIKTTYQYKTGGGAYPVVFGYSGGTDYQAPCLTMEGGYFRLFLSSSGGSWNLNTALSSLKPVNGEIYDFKAGFTGSKYYLDYRISDSGTDYVRVFELNSTDKVACTVPFWFGNLSLNSNYWSKGFVDLTATQITYVRKTGQGESTITFFDGKTAKAGVDYTVRNMTTSSRIFGQILPELDCGALNVFTGWEELKNLKLTKGA